MMWNNFNWMYIGWFVHIVFVILFVIGAVLFVGWAIKALSKDQLKNWIIWFLMIGAIGVLVTAGWGFNGMKNMHNFDGLGWMSMHLMDEEHDEFSSSEEWREHMLEEMEEHMGIY